jgi:hypothetical protein
MFASAASISFEADWMPVFLFAFSTRRDGMRPRTVRRNNASSNVRRPEVAVQPMRIHVVGSP